MPITTVERWAILIGFHTGADSSWIQGSVIAPNNAVLMGSWVRNYSQPHIRNESLARSTQQSRTVRCRRTLTLGLVTSSLVESPFIPRQHFETTFFTDHALHLTVIIDDSVGILLYTG